MWSVCMFVAFVLLLNICLVCGASGTSSSAFKTVRTGSGVVIGRFEETIRNKRPFYAFRGIPYAKPPTGQRRFKVCSILHLCD